MTQQSFQPSEEPRDPLQGKSGPKSRLRKDLGYLPGKEIVDEYRTRSWGEIRKAYQELFPQVAAYLAEIAPEFDKRTLKALKWCTSFCGPPEPGDHPLALTVPRSGCRYEQNLHVARK